VGILWEEARGTPPISVTANGYVPLEERQGARHFEVDGAGEEAQRLHYITRGLGLQHRRDLRRQVRRQYANELANSTS
jgi:hypothetical protein